MSAVSRGNYYANTNCTDRVLYLGNKTMQERGYKVGDRVLVGGDYSQPEGTIVGLSNEFPHKAQVRLNSPSGSSVTCWIKSEYLS